MAKYYGKVATLEERWNDIKPYAEVLLEETDTVLDIGCAEGLLTDEIAKLVRRVDSVEKNPNYEWKAKFQNIMRFNCDITTFKLSSDVHSYDVIFCLGVLHKLKELNLSILLSKLFKSNARLLFFRTRQNIDISTWAWSNYYSVFKRNSAYENQGPIYICQKLKV